MITNPGGPATEGAHARDAVNAAVNRFKWHGLGPGLLRDRCGEEAMAIGGFRVAKMDCAAEAQLVRMAVSDIECINVDTSEIAPPSTMGVNVMQTPAWSAS